MLVSGWCDPFGGGCESPHPLFGLANCPGVTNPPGAIGHFDFCFKAVAETGGWWAPQTRASGPAGSVCPPAEQLGPRSCADFTADYYLVDNSLFELSGRVMTLGAPRPGVAVQAQGPGGTRRTRTDAKGFYLFALHGGTYTVNVVTKRSQPRSRTVKLTRDRLGNDFEIPCGAACKLKVLIKPLERARSGLAVHTEPYGLYPADFFVPGREAPTCESGCTDVLITVSDPSTGKPVPDATVNVSASGLRTNLRADEAGSEELCHNGKCGHQAHLSRLQTDENGQLRVQYWAPGLVRSSRTTLNATARKPCSAAACPVREKVGSATMSLEVSPYLIYAHTETLSKAEAEELAAYGGGTGFFNRVLHTVTGEGLLAPPLEAAIGWFNLLEEALDKHIVGLAALEVVSRVVFVAEVLKVGTEVWERLGTIDAFLKALDLHPTGLDTNPVEAATPFITGQLQDDLISPHVLLPFGVGASGVAYHLATFLHEREQAQPHEFEHIPWELSVTIHEISFCDPAEGPCGPGYRGIVGTSQVVNPGIEPRLLLDFRVKGGPDPRNTFIDTLGLPYNTPAWMESQSDLRNLTPPA